MHEGRAETSGRSVIWAPQPAPNAVSDTGDARWGEVGTQRAELGRLASEHGGGDVLAAQPPGDATVGAELQGAGGRTSAAHRDGRRPAPVAQPQLAADRHAADQRHPLEPQDPVGDSFSSPQISFSIAERAAAQLKLAASADGIGRMARNVIVTGGVEAKRTP
jgi:hypothetical protein